MNGSASSVALSKVLLLLFHYLAILSVSLIYSMFYPLALFCAFYIIIFSHIYIYRSLFLSPFSRYIFF